MRKQSSISRNTGGSRTAKRPDVCIYSTLLYPGAAKSMSCSYRSDRPNRLPLAARAESLFLALLGAFCTYAGSATHAATIPVAVAANFTSTAKAIAECFQRESSHSIQISGASSGQLFSQIRNSGPWEVFLSADNILCQKLISEGHAVQDTAHIYARGRVALWSRERNLKLDKSVLEKKSWKRFALADPELAPYGKAALDVLNKFNIFPTPPGRRASAGQQKDSGFVFATSVAGVLKFVKSGNAEYGIVSLSHVKALSEEEQGSYWLIPEEYHGPILQEMVLLKKGELNPAAKQFIEFVRGDRARNIIREAGYESDS